ncbi:MAG: ATP-binding protein, partial [Chloroflexales bacterium]|nr:ATP-binding protein [Chloroflexales bacterium]
PQLLGDAIQECDHMTRLVEDLLLLSRLDTGRLQLERRAVDLSDLLAEVQRQVGRLVASRDIQLCLERTIGSVWGDPTRLRLVLLIVLDNALRHTPPGGTIQVDTALRGRHVQIIVTDTGVGIASEHVAHLFERFYRVDNARGADNSSTGLGLSIAKALVEAQQGWITITSELGRGTRVTIALPAL